jgi:hypothetical protein
MVHLYEVNTLIWDQIIDSLEEKYGAKGFSSDEIAVDWRNLAHRRKIDREIFEKYGYFKDIILHPKFQVMKGYYERNIHQIDFNFFVGDPLLPTSTAVILLFLIYGKVDTNILFFASSLLFNINPIYVTLAIMLLWFSSKKKIFPKNHKTGSVRNKKKVIHAKPVAFTMEKSSHTHEIIYDHILIGSNISTLYAAALLSKNGHSCCVLQPSQSPLTSVTRLRDSWQVFLTLL